MVAGDLERARSLVVESVDDIDYVNIMASTTLSNANVDVGAALDGLPAPVQASCPCGLEQPGAARSTHWARAVPAPMATAAYWLHMLMQLGPAMPTPQSQHDALLALRARGMCRLPAMPGWCAA